MEHAKHARYSLRYFLLLYPSQKDFPTISRWFYAVFPVVSIKNSGIVCQGSVWYPGVLC